MAVPRCRLCCLDDRARIDAEMRVEVRYRSIRKLRDLCPRFSMMIIASRIVVL